MRLEHNGRDFLRRLAALLGAALLASAAVCWIAANWPHASALQKLAGVQIALTASSLLACAFPFIQKYKKPQATGASANGIWMTATLGLAAVLVGALLALIGQTYQTGADPWQLFTLWAALLLPWVIASPGIFMLSLWATVLNTGVWLFFHQFVGLDFAWIALSLTLLNAALLVAHEGLGVKWNVQDRWRVLPRLLAAALMGWWLLAMIDEAFALLPGLMLGGGLAWMYTRLRSDPVIISLLGLTACIELCVLIFRHMHFEAALSLTLVVLIAALVFGMRGLLELMRRMHANSAAGQDGQGAQTGEPWFISAARLLLMSLLALVSLPFMLLVLDVDDGAAPLGMVLMLLGVWLVSKSTKTASNNQTSGTFKDAGLICVVAGYAVYVFGVFEGWQISFGAQTLLAALPALAVYLLCPVFVLRFYCALISLSVAAAWLWKDAIDWHGSGFDGQLPVLAGAFGWVLMLSILSLLAWRQSAASTDPQRYTPLAWALFCLALFAALLTPAMSLFAFLGSGTFSGRGMLSMIGLLALLLYALYRLWTPRLRVPWMPWSVAALWLLVAGIAWLGAPGVLIALTWLMLGRALQQRALMVISTLALLAYLALFYWQLQTPLLHKAWVLGASGAWLALGAALMMGWGKSSSNIRQPQHTVQRPTRPERKGWADRMHSSGLALGLMLILGVANSVILARENQIRHGTPVVLELAPVDPRSLMQGDYMTLRFQISTQIRQRLRGRNAPRLSGRLILQADDQGVHRLVNVVLDDGQNGNTAAPSADEPKHIALNFRVVEGGVRIVTNAWFFPEGQAAHYAKARYGLFAVDVNGRGLLVDVLDADKKSLKASAAKALNAHTPAL